MRERHASSHERLREVAAILKARGGGIEGLLELLADPVLTAEKRSGVQPEELQIPGASNHLGHETLARARNTNQGDALGIGQPVSSSLRAEGVLPQRQPPFQHPHPAHVG